MQTANLKHLWWVAHHSENPARRTLLLTCYIDESGTDSESPAAVVGGILLEKSEFMRFDRVWKKCLLRHHITWPLHMREFGPRGKFKDIRSEERRALFADVVKLINQHKSLSVAATLQSEEYRNIFSGISNLSMYGACFANVVMLVGIGSRQVGIQKNIAYVLDGGNVYANDVLDAHGFLQKNEFNVGSLTFDSDDRLAALQAADVISWATRRRDASKLKSGFEPLSDLLNDDHHIEAPYKAEWMKDVATALRAKMEP